MKVQVNKTEKKFEPIELKITIESEEELCSLWHRTNASPNEIDGLTSGELSYNSLRHEEFFKVLDDIIKIYYPHLKKQ